MSSFGMHVRFDGSFDEALVKVTDGLKDEGFGVLTEIDIQATFKKKLGVDFRRYKMKEIAREVHEKLRRVISHVGERH